MELPIAPLKALADRNRLRIVLALAKHPELCACQITELLGVTGATASRHLSQLQRCGLLASRKEGRWVWFRLQAAPQHAALLAWATSCSQRTDDDRRDARHLKRILAMDPETLCRQQRGEACCPQEAR